jgi:non-specific serine/threonine protein kinase/serine/threonine-protein kinase
VSDAFAWEEAKRIFQEAVALEPEERDGFLREACAASPGLLAEVRSLLEWHTETDEDEWLPTGNGAARGGDEAPLVGQSLGPWRIVDLIGRGGMGVVYRAERADGAFTRQAAIKVVGAGPQTPDIVERFRFERETLAALDHPNIARLLDAGATADGQPYFVMELVAGTRVDRFCDEHRLSIAQRIDLFQSVCRGVEYAHENLVLHRDIKPDNILVTREGTPKLLDFGVAKLLSRDTGPGTRGPTAVTWLMTPDYASPEQASGRPVTTAADVYSLGVLLHELLTGVRPYRRSALMPPAIQAQLEAAPFIAPSVRAAAGEDAEQRAARRGVTPRQLSRLLAGDIDAIVGRALSLDPRHRYATVDQFAADLERHRTGYPVAARGRDVGYLAGRFVRRHALALAVGAGIVLLVLGGLSAVLWQTAVAAEARARAERRFEDLRQLAGTFMVGVHDAIAEIPGTTAARAVIVNTTVKYLDSLAREAEGDRRLQQELAAAYLKVGDAQGNPTNPNLGDVAGAITSYKRAIEIATVLRVDDDIEPLRMAAMAHRRLGDVLAWSGDPEQAVAHSRESKVLYDRIAPGNAAPADRLQSGIASIKLGDFLGNPNFPNVGRVDAAAREYDAALGLLRDLAVRAPDDPQVRRYLALAVERIGTLHEAAGRWPQAMAAYRESFDIRQALAANQPLHTDTQRDLGVAHEKLGSAQRSTGDRAGAAASYRAALAIYERLARADPSNTNAARTLAVGRANFAEMLAEDREGRADARDLLRAALATHRALAERDKENAQARCDATLVAVSLGDLLSTQGDASAACASWREGLQFAEALAAAGRDACVDRQRIERLPLRVRACR